MPGLAAQEFDLDLFAMPDGCMAIRRATGEAMPNLIVTGSTGADLWDCLDAVTAGLLAARAEHRVPSDGMRDIRVRLEIGDARWQRPFPFWDGS